MLRAAILALVPLILPAASARAAAWDVYPDGSGDVPTIAAAIAIAASGDSILIHPGVYFEHDLTGGPGDLTIVGMGAGPEDVVVDADHELAFTLVGPTKYERVTVRNANRALSSGTNLLIEAVDCRIVDCLIAISVESVVRVTDCSFENNIVGIGARNIRATDCLFRSNGAPVTAFFQAVLTGCLAESNTDDFSAVGLLSITDSVFLDNEGLRAGQGVLSGSHFERNTGAFTFSSQADVSGCTFVDNSVLATAFSLVVSGCAFVDPSGAAVRMVAGDLSIDGCLFSGGASELLQFGSVSTVDARNSTFVGFHGLSTGDASFEVERCLFASWTAEAAFPPALWFTATCSNFYPGPTPTNDPIVRALLSGPTNISADPAFCSLADGPEIAPYSRCAPEGNECGFLIGAGQVSCPESVGVYVASSPPGLVVMGDGESRTADAAFPWVGGSVHEISVPSPQTYDYGSRYTFNNWDDGGDQTHSVTVSEDNVVATAQFDVEHYLEVVAEPGGTASPASGFQAGGASVEIEAVPDQGFAFAGWVGLGSGSYSGPLPVATVVPSEPLVQTAVFVPSTDLTVHTSPPGRVVTVMGQEYVAPVTLSLPSFQNVTVGVDSLQFQGTNERSRYLGWSDGLARVHLVFLFTESQEITALLVDERELTFESTAAASFLPEAGWYPYGSMVEIEAVPDFEHTFTSWTGTGDGSYTGPDNPATVTMNEPIHQIANLVPAFDGSGYDFTISASSTDPFVHQDVPTGGLRQVYFWGTCLQRGLSAFTGIVSGSFQVLAFTPADGVFNVGTPTDLLIAVGGCPTGNDVNRLLGSWIVNDTGGTICFADPESAGAVDCDAGLFMSPRFTGFTTDGSVPCRVGENGCDKPVPVRFSQLAASVTGRAVVLSWSTSAEVSHAGFRIYRATAIDGERKRLTPELLTGSSPYEWVDRSVLGDAVYFYWIGAVSSSGAEQFSDPVRVQTPPWGPRVTALTGVIPNPSTGAAEIRFLLARTGDASLVIYDVAGRRVRTLQSGALSAGEHRIQWDGRNASGRVVPAGVYFARFVADGKSEVRKVLRLGEE